MPLPYPHCSTSIAARLILGSNAVLPIAVHAIAVLPIAVHDIAVHAIAVHAIVVHAIAAIQLQYTPLQYIALLYIQLQQWYAIPAQPKAWHHSLAHYMHCHQLDAINETNYHSLAVAATGVGKFTSWYAEGPFLQGFRVL